MKKETTLPIYIIEYIKQGLWDNPELDKDYDLEVLGEWIEDAISAYEGGAR